MSWRDRVVHWTPMDGEKVDILVWENKAYKERPMLNKSDGDILKFRGYCRQFYPDQPDGERRAPRQAAVG